MPLLYDKWEYEFAQKFRDQYNTNKLHQLDVKPVFVDTMDTLQYDLACRIHCMML